MEQITLYEFLRKLVNEGKGEQIYNLFDCNASMVIVTMTAKSMLECLGVSIFLTQKVYDMYRNHIILDCEVFINESKC